MSELNSNFSLIAAVAVGAIAGLILGNYLWGNQERSRTVSQHLSTLTKVLEQIEGINTKEAEDLKGRINNIVTTIESNYGSTKG